MIRPLIASLLCMLICAQALAGDVPNPAALLAGQTVQLPDTGGEYALNIDAIQPAVRLRTRKGASVRLRLSSAKAQELHLHGYDQTVRLKAGETAVLSFTANRAGRFELETHSGHRTVLVIEVLP